MSKSHLSMKELKHDAIQDAGKTAFDYIRDHGPRILTVLCVVIVVVAAIQIGLGFSARRGQDAADMLMAARREYARAVVAADGVERDRVLETAAQGCQNLRLKFGSSNAAMRSLLLEGHCETLRGNLDKALELYKQYLSKAGTAEEKAQGNLAVGQAYANIYFKDNAKADALDQARKHYESAAKMPSDGERPYVGWEAMLALARTYRMSGDLEKAAAILGEVKAARPFYRSGEESEKPQGDDERAAATADLRANVRQALSAMSFEKEAERQLEEVEAQLRSTTATAAAAR